MAIRYGRRFRTRKGRYGRYKYVNGKRVGFVGSRGRRSTERKASRYFKKKYGIKVNWSKGKWTKKNGKWSWHRR